VTQGDSTRLTATAIGLQGDTIPDAAFSWSSTSPAIAEVDQRGVVRGRTTGFAQITASFGTNRATAGIVVNASPAVLVGAGDIASCSYDDDEATAKLLDAISGVVFTAGDDAYSSGTPQQFADCYQPTWGRHRERTRPSPGNHEYNTPGAAGYYHYYGALAGDSGLGNFSYDVGGWHIISLNSNLAMAAGSPQEQWLRADLSLHPASCILAYWHHPRFSSGTTHGSWAGPQPLWQALYDAGTDVIVVEGTGRSALRAGAGHYPGTPLPGQPGNVAIAGHRSLPPASSTRRAASVSSSSAREARRSTRSVPRSRTAKCATTRRTA